MKQRSKSLSRTILVGLTLSLTPIRSGARELLAFGVGPSGRGRVLLFREANGGQLLQFIDHNNRITKEWRGQLPAEQAILSRRGRYVGIAKWSGLGSKAIAVVEVWSSDAEKRWTLKGVPCCGISVTDRGVVLAAARGYRGIVFYHPDSITVRVDFSTSPILDSVWSPNGEGLLQKTMDGRVQCATVASGKVYDFVPTTEAKGLLVWDDCSAVMRVGPRLLRISPSGRIVEESEARGLPRRDSISGDLRYFAVQDGEFLGVMEKQGFQVVASVLVQDLDIVAAILPKSSSEVVVEGRKKGGSWVMVDGSGTVTRTISRVVRVIRPGRPSSSDLIIERSRSRSNETIGIVYQGYKRKLLVQDLDNVREIDDAD